MSADEYLERVEGKPLRLRGINLGNRRFENYRSNPVSITVLGLGPE